MKRVLKFIFLLDDSLKLVCFILHKTSRVIACQKQTTKKRDSVHLSRQQKPLQNGGLVGLQTMIRCQRTTTSQHECVFISNALIVLLSTRRAFQYYPTMKMPKSELQVIEKQIINAFIVINARKDTLWSPLLPEQ